jgi:phosphoglycerate dehydrogenase-like enzyme
MNRSKSLKKSAFIVNTSRGNIVDVEATCQAVKTKQLSGFASDVFPIEPFNASHFSDISNLYFTPHMGGNAQEAVLAMGRSAIDHVRSFLNGTMA